MATRTIAIQPATTPGGAATQVEITLTLVDEDRNPVTRGNVIDDRLIVGEGRHIIGSDPYDLVLTTQDSIPGESWWRVEIPQGRHYEAHYVQIAAGAQMTWDEFLGSGAPVDAADIWSSRLLPTNPANGQMAIYDAASGTWVPVTPSGTGDMQTVTYDPRLISDDTFDLANSTGTLECPVF